MRFGGVILAGLCLWLSCPPPALAQDAFAGSWVVSGTQPAPWVNGSNETQPDVDPALRHAKITFKEGSVDAPPPLGCKNAKYELTEVGPDYLFQGGLTDPVKQAAALGFTSQKIANLYMGCVSNDADIEMDFDLVDPNTVVFALNNVIYKMVRTPAQ